MDSIVPNTTYGSLPTFPKFGLNSLENILRKVNKLVLPAILLLGSQAIQGADSIGCIGCVVCLQVGLVQLVSRSA